VVRSAGPTLQGHRSSSAPGHFWSHFAGTFGGDVLGCRRRISVLGQKGEISVAATAT